MEIIRDTVGGLLLDVSRRYPSNEALVHTEAGVRFTYDLLLWEAGRAAKGLIRLGIEPGDHVALWAPNIPEWIVAQVALARMGAVMVPVDPGLEAEELGYVLEQSEARAVMLARGQEGEEYVSLMQSIRDRIPSLEHVVLFGDTALPETILWNELTAMGDELSEEALQEREQAVSPEDPLAVMYTSGTTGKPKGVVLDHLGLVNKSMASTERQGIGRTDRLCLFFPLFHMFGNTCVALAGLLRGAALVMPCRAFEPEAILKTIRSEACTAIYGSPSMIIALLDHPRFNPKHWGSLTKGTLGGAPCPMELMKRLVEKIGVSGITVAYGITETASWVTMTHPDDPVELRVSTIGRPLEVNEVRITDPRSGEELPPLTQGELCVRGFIMKEYFKMPAATAASVDQDGWFHSADLGEIAENGYVRITGRIKDLIEREGVPVHPTEIEEILYGFPGINEVQVFGFPDPDKGQEIAAWIRPGKGTEVDLDDVRSYVEERVGPEKRPLHYKLVSSFPTTRSGKVQKSRLAEAASKEYS